MIIMRYSRLLAPPLTVWSLVMLPTLCIGGIIGHQCDCTSESLCEHEAECKDDPCGDLSVTVKQREETVYDTPLLSGFEFSSNTVNHFITTIVRLATAADQHNNCLHLPFAPSDQPLLI